MNLIATIFEAIFMRTNVHETSRSGHDKIIRAILKLYYSNLDPQTYLHLKYKHFYVVKFVKEPIYEGRICMFSKRSQ